MSAYVQFFIKNGDKFIELFAKSRSTYTFKYLNGKWGKVEKLTSEILNEAIKGLERELNEEKAKITEQVEKLKKFGETKPEYKDWNRAYYDVKQLVSESKEEIDLIKVAISEMYVLSEIEESFRFGSQNVELWYGTEVGFKDDGTLILED